MNNIDSLLTQNIASVITAGGFLWYLTRKDEMNRKTFDSFNQMISNHLKHSLKTETQLAKALQSLKNTIENLNHAKSR